MTLLILKIAGFVFAAGAGIASFLKSKGFEEIETPSLIIGAPKQITRRLTREAKIGTLLLILGLLVSLVANTIDQSLNNERNAKMQNALSNQLQRAEANIALTTRSLEELKMQNLYSQASLEQIELLVTRFQDMSIIATFQFSADDFEAANLIKADLGLQAIEKQMATETTDHVGSPPTGYFRNFALPLQTITEGTNIKVTLSIAQLASLVSTSNQQIRSSTIHPLDRTALKIVICHRFPQRKTNWLSSFRNQK